jgi:ankyrin repeat protein
LYFTVVEGPLHAAAKKGHAEVCKILIELGAEINLKNKAGKTPYFEATMNGNLDAAKVLEKAGGKM